MDVTTNSFQLRLFCDEQISVQILKVKWIQTGFECSDMGKSFSNPVALDAGFIPSPSFVCVVQKFIITKICV